MNLDKVLEAAHEIKRLKLASDARSKAWQDLAKDAKNPEISWTEIMLRRNTLDSSVVVDFGTAVNTLVYWLDKE